MHGVLAVHETQPVEHLMLGPGQRLRVKPRTACAHPARPFRLTGDGRASSDPRIADFDQDDSGYACLAVTARRDPFKAGKQ